MDFLWSEVQLAFKESVRKFAEEEISPRTLERDLKDEFHWQAWEKAVEFGLLGLPIPEEYGRGGRYINYCSIFGFGQNDLYRDRGSHDINCVAIAGLLSVTGRKGEGPGILETQLGDIAAGIMGAYSILVAVLARQKTGEGQYINVSMMDSAIGPNSVSFFEYFLRGKVFGQGGYRLLGTFPCYNIYEMKDGRYITIGTLEPKFWSRLCHVLNRYDPIDKQYDASDAVFSEVQDIFLSKTRKEWNGLLESEEVCYAPVLNLQEATEVPQVRARNMFINTPIPEKTGIKHIGIVLRFSSTIGRIILPSPDVGQNTVEILREIDIQ